MKITKEQYELIAHCFSLPRGNLNIDNMIVINSILYVAEHGCKWRGLPERFGNWHTIYTRMNRWAKNGVLDRVFTELQKQQIVQVNIESVSIDSTSIKAHPDGTGAQKKRSASHRQIARRMDHQASSGCRGFRTALVFALSPGNNGDGPEGRKLLNTLADKEFEGIEHVIMDKAYEGDETRQLVLDLGFEPVVPPKSNRLEPWEYDRELYKKRNEVERLIRRVKGFRRVFSRFDKLDCMFLAFIHFAFSVEMLRDLC